MKESLKRKITTVFMLCIMLMAMGTVVFGAYAKNEVVFSNEKMKFGTDVKSEYYTCTKAATCPSTMTWDNVVTEGNIMLDMSTPKTILSIPVSVDKKEIKVKKTTSNQVIQVKWYESGLKLRFEMSGCGNIDARVKQYIVRYN